MAVAVKAKKYYSICGEKQVIEFEWSFVDWSLVSDSYKKKDLESPKFMVDEDTNCYLRTSLYVFNHDHTYSSSVSMILDQINFCSIKMSVSFISEQKKTLITNSKVFQSKSHFANLAVALCHPNIDVKQYLRNDTLTLLCEITTVKSIIKSDITTDIRNVGFCVDSSKKFEEMYRSKELYDVTFRFGIEGKELKAHKFVLATNSPVFKAMFKTNMIERHHGVVNINDAKFAVFDIFLKYLYTGEINKIEEVVEDLVIVADKYQVMGLKNLCVQFMLQTVNKKNASKYMLTAHKISCQELQKKAASVSNS